MHWSATNTVQTFDKTASAEAVTDKPPTQSVLHLSTRGVKDYKLEQLRVMEDVKRNFPDQQHVTRGNWCSQILGDLYICDDNDHLAKQLSTKLVHKKVTPHYVQSRYMVCPEDDPVILREMKTFLSQYPNLKPGEKKATAEKFIKHNFFLNWTTFYLRNKLELGVAIAGTEIGGMAVALDTLGENWNASDARHQVTLVTLNTNNNNTMLQISSDRKADLASMTASHERQTTQSNNTIMSMTASHERQNTESNKTIMSITASHERIQQELVALNERQNSESNKTIQQMFSAMVASQERSNQLLVEATPTNRTKQKAVTERKASGARTLFPKTPAPDKRVKAATERKAGRAPGTPATDKKVKAVPVVERVLNDELPLSKNGIECGYCKRTWNKNFCFCSRHKQLLEEMTYIVQD